jgi:hypothetical protein
LASQLGVYNEALGHLAERKLASLSESVEPRRVLDDYWDGCKAYCIEQGFWKFAARSVQLTADDGVEPAFGFTYAFEHPDDFVRTYLISEVETFDPPLLDYQDEAGYWWANPSSIYVRYISNSVSYGNNIGEWPQSFADYVALQLAFRACKRVNGSESDWERLKKRQKEALLDARSKDAMMEPLRFPPRGSWVASRGGASNRSRWNGGFI